MFTKQLIAVFLCVLPALATPSPLILVKRNKDPVPGSYLVIFKENVDHALGVSSITDQISSHSKITKKWNTINGVAGTFSDADVELLRSLPTIAFIEEDGYVHTQSLTTQTDAPWGLGRISSNITLENYDSSSLVFSYHYDTSAGAGSNVYIIDSGIDNNHPAFEGRAHWGFNAQVYVPMEASAAKKLIPNPFIFPVSSDTRDNTDGFGHGTHCAGIAMSGPYGVAKSANAYAVKVINDDGSGQLDDVISGIDFVAQRVYWNDSRPSVATLNFRTASKSDTLNHAVAKLAAFGITTVVSAGNEGVDASEYSPASEPTAITVGATTIADAKATFSNWGDSVDIYAPGYSIISTWTNGTTKSIKGTSVASCFVAGYAAYILAINPSMTPKDVSYVIRENSLKGFVAGVAPAQNFLLSNRLYV